MKAIINRKFITSCGRKFKLKKVNKQYFEGGEGPRLLGQINWDKSIIKIATKNRNIIDINQTVIHEIIHNISREQSLRLSERAVAVLANNIYTDFVANKFVFK